MHSGITEYFGNKLSLAPLTDPPPTSILELGYVRMCIIQQTISHCQYMKVGEWCMVLSFSNTSGYIFNMIFYLRAIHAASMFPRARVTAVDLSVLPARYV